MYGSQVVVDSKFLRAVHSQDEKISEFGRSDPIFFPCSGGNLIHKGAC